MARPARSALTGKVRSIEADDVLDQVVLVGVADLGVGVPAPAAVGHDDDQGQALDVALDARAPHPDRVVVRQAVEQVEDRPGPADRRVVREDHADRRRLLERAAVVVDAGERHGVVLSIIVAVGVRRAGRPDAGRTFGPAGLRRYWRRSISPAIGARSAGSRPRSSSSTVSARADSSARSARSRMAERSIRCNSPLVTGRLASPKLRDRMTSRVIGSLQRAVSTAASPADWQGSR